MASGEVRIAIPTTRAGAFDAGGANVAYVQLRGPMGKLAWTHDKEAATVYPNETWARRDLASFGVPAFARVESVTE